MPVNLIQLARIFNLAPRILASNRQAHCMSPATISPHIPQSSDIAPYYPS